LAAAGVVALAAAVAGSGILWRRAVVRRAEDRLHSEAATRELGEKVRKALEEALELAKSGEFGAADVRVSAARALKPGDPAVEAAAREVRVQFVMKRVGEVAAKPEPSAEELSTARSLLAMNSDLAGEPEVRRLARLVEGTCSWSLESAVEGIEVDIAAAEPGIYWDEEIFPPMAAARAAGLCVRVGAAPIAPRDIAFGEVHIVLSRDGVPVRLIPVNFARNTSRSFEYRVFRVGGSADATHARLEDALDAARPGGAILLESMGFGGIEIHNKPGLLLAAVPGARPIISNAVGPGVYAGECWGIRLRDITVGSAAGAIFSFSSSSRASIIRCSSSSRGNAGIQMHSSGEWHARDCVILSGQGNLGIHSDRLPGCLALRCTIDGGGWDCVESSADRARFVKCRILNGQLAAMHLQGADSELIECEFRDCPNWGVIAEGKSERLLVRDCHFVNCGARPSTSKYAGALVVCRTGATVVHNTFAGCTFTALTFLGTGVIRDNLFAPVVDFTTPSGAILLSCPLFLRGDDDGPCLEGNLFTGCTLVARIRESECATEELFQRETAGMNCPAGKSPALRRLDDATAATVRDEGRLASGSPLLTAATDGGPAGVRFDALAADASGSEDWMKRDIGRIYARRGSEALGKGDTASASGFLAKARLMAPSDPAVADLAARLK
ncbi:MAG: hypothetical protein FD180_4033, partial [Planctomycetota bacterium]